MTVIDNSIENFLETLKMYAPSIKDVKIKISLNYILDIEFNERLR